MIPTVLLFGFLFGRWWKIAIPAAILGWPAFLVADGVVHGLPFAVAAGLLAAGNVAVGALAFQLVRRLIRPVAARARDVIPHS